MHTIVCNMQVNVVCPPGHSTAIKGDTREHSNANNIYCLWELCPSETLFLQFGSLLSLALCNSHEMFFLPLKTACFTLSVIRTNYIALSHLSTQCKCKYIISRHEAKTHFRTLKTSFQNQSPDLFQAIISITALLLIHCGDSDFTVGQATGHPHKQKFCSYSIVPQSAGKSQCSSVCPSEEQKILWNL